MDDDAPLADEDEIWLLTSVLHRIREVDGVLNNEIENDFLEYYFELCLDLLPRIKRYRWLYCHNLPRFGTVFARLLMFLLVPICIVDAMAIVPLMLFPATIQVFTHIDWLFWPVMTSIFVCAGAMPVLLVLGVLRRLDPQQQYADISVAVALYNCCSICKEYANANYSDRIELRRELLLECRYAVRMIRTELHQRWYMIDREETRQAFKKALFGFANTIEEKYIWILTPETQTFDDLFRYFERSFTAFMRQEWGMLDQSYPPHSSWKRILYGGQRLGVMIAQLLIPLAIYLGVHRFIPALGSAVDVFAFILAFAIVVTWLGPSFEPITMQVRTWYDLFRPK